MCLELCARPCTTPCGHNFCRGCLRESLKHNHRCPKCRKVCVSPSPAKSAGMEYGRQQGGGRRRGRPACTQTSLPCYLARRTFTPHSPIELCSLVSPPKALPGTFDLTINFTLWNTIQLLFPATKAAPATPPAVLQVGRHSQGGQLLEVDIGGLGGRSVDGRVIHGRWCFDSALRCRLVFDPFPL